MNYGDAPLPAWPHCDVQGCPRPAVHAFQVEMPEGWVVHLCVPCYKAYLDPALQTPMLGGVANPYHCDPASLREPIIESYTPLDLNAHPVPAP